MKKIIFKPNTEEKCLLETIIGNVIHYNQSSKTFEATLSIKPQGVSLAIRGVLVGDASSPTAHSQEELEELLNLLNKKFEEEENDEKNIN